MSSDHQVLEAIAVKTRQEMRYFELVRATCGDSPFTCYTCLGKHAIFFLGPDLNKIHEGWKLSYVHLVKVVQDKNSHNTLMFVLNERKSTGWKSDRLFLRCENRELMLKHLRCSWQTDHMWRVGRVGAFPLSRHELTKESCAPPTKPFINYKWVKYNQYCVMVPCNFECQPNSIQAGNTGEYINDSGVSLAVHVHEAMTLDQLAQLKREHIRWVAEEYKLQLVRGERQFYILRNQQRHKRMNLTGDMAAWYSWELIIMTPSATLICLLLRRQYIPPVCNVAQDIAVLMRCPVDGRGNLSKDLLIEAHLIADSVCPDATTVIPYRTIVKAKLDGLRFDDESLDWVKSHLKLDTRWQNYAKAFLKAILTIFVDGSSLPFSKDLLRSPELKPKEDSSEEEAEEPVPEGIEGIIEAVRRFSEKKILHADKEEKTKVKNRWVSRVARYFAWAVDGGVLQSKFTLDLMVYHITQLTDSAYKRALKALRFMLHIRPLDMMKPYDEGPLVNHLKDTNLAEWTFNDRVVRALLAQDYLRKRLGRQNDADYYECMSNLLRSNAGTHVKAYICRLFMENQKKPVEDDNVNLIVVPSLVQILDSGGPFLATYASAALVNLSDGNDAVKMKLFECNVAGLACKNVKTKDDELIGYTLMLLVNLTKQPHHRHVIANSGFLPLLYDLLTSSYHLCKTTAGLGGVSGTSLAGSATKVRLLTQVCILIGHFSIDEVYRQLFLDDTFGHTVKCLLWMFDESSPGGSLMCKVMFALKQLCKDRSDQKQSIGAHVAGRLVERLGGKSREGEFERTSEFLFQTILLLQTLVTLSTNCEVLDKGKEYWEGRSFYDYLDELRELPQARKINALEDRVRQIKESVQQAVFKELAAM